MLPPERLRALRGPLVLAAFVLTLLAGCRAEAPRQRELLVDELHEPLVLTENRIIELPSSLAPNRMIRGWWPFELRGREGVRAGAGARIQAVNLTPQPRRLILRGRVSPESGGEVEVRFADRPWQRVALAPQIRVPVPEDLPLGRFTIDFRVDKDVKLAVFKASFSRAAAAGQVKIDGADVIQEPASLVVFARPVGKDAVVTGRFAPPRSSSDGQRFALLASVDGSAEEEIFAWEAGDPGGEREVRAELGRGEFARVRLLATGEGAAAQWRQLAIESNARRVMAPEPERARPPPEAPQVVILYIMDALRRDHVGHLGGLPEISPTLDRLASEGATFKRHFSVAPNTVPSMKTLLAGRVFLLYGGHKLPLDLGTTLAQRFSEKGYVTGLFSGNGNVSPWRGMDRGYDHVSNRVLYGAKGSTGRAGYNNSAERVHAAMLRWMGWYEFKEKLFAHAQTIHPHNPYDPPEPFLSRFVPDNGSTIDGRTPTLTSIRAKRKRVDKADEERLRGLYAAGVAYNDAYLDDFLASLLEEVPREEVMLIVTSDHGEELFDHGGVLHGYTLYEEQLEIPLIVWWPGTIKPRQISSLTDNQDLYATLSSMIEPTSSFVGGGKSLWPLLLSDESEEKLWDKEIIFSAASAVPGGIFAARSDRYKVVYAPRRGPHWGMGQGLGRGSDPEYFFDLEEDPGESTNLIGTPSPAADWLWSRLMVWIEAGKRLEAGETLDEMDEATRESLRALGYIE